MKKVMGFVGLPGAGKSSALKIAKRYGKIIVMGDIIRNEAKLLVLEPSDENLGQIAQDLRQKYGPEIIALRTIELINQSKEDVIFIDGIRSPNEADLFKKHFEIKIIAIHAPDQLRLHWIKERKRIDDSDTELKIKTREKREIGFGLQKIIDHADFTLENTGTIQDLEIKCESLIQKILNAKNIK